MPINRYDSESFTPEEIKALESADRLTEEAMTEAVSLEQFKIMSNAADVIYMATYMSRYGRLVENQKSTKKNIFKRLFQK